MTGRIFIGGISPRASFDDIAKFISGYGPILQMYVKNGYAFIDFKNPDDAYRVVMELHNKSICGKPVGIEFAQNSYWINN